MGGKSTSHGAVLSSQQGPASASYDLHSWQGLTEILKRGKDALDDPSVYAEFRNLVLAYAKEGGDPELRKRIDTLVATFKEKQQTKNLEVVHKTTEPTAEEIPSETQSVHSFALGGRRMQPRFTASTRFHKEVLKTTHDAPVAQPEAVIPVVEVPPVTQTSPTSEPIHEDTKQESVQQTPEVSIVRTLEQHKSRITEIKRIIHERIGNPAALMDTHNGAGKKYMVALLSALKATGGGGTEGADSAMLGLERAFEELLRDEPEKKSDIPEKLEIKPKSIEHIKTPDVTASVQTEKEVPVTVSDIPELKVVPDERKIVPLAPTPIQEKKMISEANVSEIKQKSDEDEKPFFEPSIFTARGIDSTDKATKDVSHHALKNSDAVIANVLNSNVMQHVSRETLQSVPIDEKKLGDSDENLKSDVTVKNIIEEPPIKKIVTPEITAQSKHVNHGMGTQTIDEIKQTTGIDPADVALRQTELFTNEITEALNELLHEWRVFTSSGLFGTGPGGSEHPLYIRLAPLSMGEVVAGRWEGTNPKTLKSIKEYIDAWRHEQGIAYTINETFEHYLRRVVQKILKRQNQN